MKIFPGNVNIGHDGLTTKYKSMQSHTVSKGRMHVLYSLSDLGSKNHDSSAEVEDLTRISTSTLILSIR